MRVRGMGTIAAMTLVGGAVGALCGLVDGARAGVAAQLDPAGVLAASLLVASIDGLCALVLAAVLAKLRFVFAWGRRVCAPRWAGAIAFVVTGALAAVGPALVTLQTAMRMNRLLAAGIVFLVAVAGVLLAVTLQPGLARLVAVGKARQITDEDPRKPLGGAALLVGALVVGAFGLVAFALVWRTHPPLPAQIARARAVWVAAVILPLPGLTVLLAGYARRLWPALGLRTAALVLGLTVSGSVATLLAMRWERDLQFVPWRHLLAFGILSALLISSYAWRPMAWLHRRRTAALVAMTVFAVLVFVGAGLTAATSEAARKATSARSGLAGPLLTLASRALDFDRDGYPALLGGGDCREGDPAINPAALDWPEDGVDQDCDGRDADLAGLKPGPFHDLPAAFPANTNVLLIAIDTLRADHLGSYGYARATSPALDKLATESVVFENSWAHAPSTRYSMPALVTGRWPSAIEWNNSIWWPGLAPRMRTIHEAMKELGFWNAAFWAFDYFDPAMRRGFERGVDQYDARRAALHRNLGGPSESAGSSAREMADDALAFLDAHAGERWFLTLHFYDPHLTYEKHPEAPDFGDQPVDRYDNEIHFTDGQIGRVLDHLRDKQLWDRTIVMVTGDHGEGLGERGIAAHGYDLYPPQTKVPLVVRAPGVTPRRVSTPVGHIDLAPTLLNLAGGRAAQSRAQAFQGSSLVDLMQGAERAESSAVFQEVSYEGNNQKRALVTATHQLIWNWTPHNTTECYDLRDADPERPDLWGTSAGDPICGDLKRRLRTLVATLALPADFRERLARDVFPAGRAAPPPQQAPGSGAVVGPFMLGDNIEVLGVDLGSRTVKRGVPVEIAVHFRVHKALPEGWRMFMHLDGPGGFENLDHATVGGAHPVQHWTAGSTIIDRHTFTLAPGRASGRHSVSLGFWRGQERLGVSPREIADGAQRLRLVELDVQ